MQSGDVARIMQLLDQKIMPNLNFQRMTASAVGPHGVRPRLSSAFARPSSRTWCAPVTGAADGAKSLTFSIKPMRYAPDDKEVIVRT